MSDGLASAARDARPTSTSCSTCSRTTTCGRFSPPAPLDREALAGELERQDASPQASGRFVVEVRTASRPATLAFERVERAQPHRALGGLAVHPRFRGRRLADEAARLFQRHLIFDLGFHRLEMVDLRLQRARATARGACGLDQGRRQAARRTGEHDEWVDGVMYGLIREDLGG